MRPLPSPLKLCACAGPKPRRWQSLGKKQPWAGGPRPTGTSRGSRWQAWCFSLPCWRPTNWGRLARSRQRGGGLPPLAVGHNRLRPAASPSGAGGLHPPGCTIPSRGEWRLSGGVISAMAVESLLLGGSAVHGGLPLPAAPRSGRRSLGNRRPAQRLSDAFAFLRRRLRGVAVPAGTPLARRLGAAALEISPAAAHDPGGHDLQPDLFRRPQRGQGATFQPFGFAFRTLAGGFFAVVFLYRGFGIAADPRRLRPAGRRGIRRAVGCGCQLSVVSGHRPIRHRSLSVVSSQWPVCRIVSGQPGQRTMDRRHPLQIQPHHIIVERLSLARPVGRRLGDFGPKLLDLRFLIAQLLDVVAVHVGIMVELGHVLADPPPDLPRCRGSAVRAAAAGRPSARSVACGGRSRPTPS